MESDRQKEIGIAGYLMTKSGCREKASSLEEGIAYFGNAVISCLSMAQLNDLFDMLTLGWW